MRTVDLSHPIKNGMQIYPGDPRPSIERGLTHEADYCHVDRLNLGSHTGTHIDVPYHFIAEGKTIDEFEPSKFIGTGVLVDVQNKKENESITVEDLEPYLEQIKAGSFVIFMTGWDRYFGEPAYERHPYVAKDCAERLRDAGVSIVGTDALNIDSTVTEQFDSHGVFLGNDILIVENLRNLNAVPREGRGFYSFLPLKIPGTDGSPIRAVYIYEAE